MGWVPSLLFALTMVEVVRITATSFKGPMRALLHWVPPILAGRRWPTPLPETPGHSWASLSQSLLLSLLPSSGSWCAQGFVCVLQESVSQSCVSSCGSMVGLMVTSSKRAYAIPKSVAPRAPSPAGVHCWPVPPQETLTVLSQSLWGLWVLVHTRYVWALWASLMGVGFGKPTFAHSTVLLGILLCPWTWGISSELLQWHAATAPVLYIMYYYDCAMLKHPYPIITAALIMFDILWSWLSFIKYIFCRNTELFNRHSSPYSVSEYL